MKKNDIVNVTIDKYVFEGKGIGKIVNAPDELSGFVIFVSFAYPGDVLSVRLIKIKKNYAEGIIEEILTPSPLRITPRCKHFGDCGGCKNQDLNYRSQAEFKEKQVKEIYDKLGGFTDANILPILSSKQEFFYRNKMEYSFSHKRWLTKKDKREKNNLSNAPALGLHVPRNFEKVLDLEECFLQSEESYKILLFTKEYFFSRNISVYRNDEHTGFLRNLVIREGKGTGNRMVNLVTFYRDEDLMQKYTAALLQEFGSKISTVVNNINSKKAMIAVGETEYIDFGPGYIEDTIGGYVFRISANSFFQTNTLQAEHLYNTALRFAGLTGKEVVYDLFCGAGTITLYISGSAKEVHGFEIAESSVLNANTNKVLNGNTNTFFYKTDLNRPLLDTVKKLRLPKPDVIIVDPPRSGLHKNTIEDILQLLPERIVYVSCNPATQVRDLKFLVPEHYSIENVLPVDMFPHTYHIECVTLLCR